MRDKNKTLLFLPDQILCPVRSGQTVLEVALTHAVELPHSCGGMGSCTTCRVLVESPTDLLPPRDELELEHAQSRHFAENERLACQLPAVAGMVLRIPRKDLVRGDG